MMKKPELLAPVGDWDSLVAAVENGADAVYMGSDLFSARAYATNFSEEELEEAIDFVHIRGVKAYVTVNTLIKDSEFEDAIDLLYQICNMGADAVIVQDIGLLSEALQAYPELPLHASTQMTAHNIPSVELLAEMGVKRIVLSREMSFESIKNLKETCGIEIEVFVHGALCICYSGQCLMSSMIGGRSGNRGYCAQPCRRKYELTKNGQEIETPGDYLLSPQDLCAASMIPELIEAGVDSFKIEGRMKRPEYVAGVVRMYRTFIDRYVESPESYYVSEDEIEDLMQLFNRGFTSAYLEGQDRGMMSRENPANRGLELGKVIGYNRNYGQVRVKLQRALKQGDGISIGETGIHATTIYRNGKRIKEAFPGDIVEISSPMVENEKFVFKTSDFSQIDTLQKTYTSPHPLRKIPVDIEARIKVGNPIEIRMKDTDSLSVQVSSDFDVEEAKSRPMDSEKIEEQLRKLGNTIFEASSINVEIEGNVFVPLKALNNLRNEAAEILAEKRAESSHRACELYILPEFSIDYSEEVPSLSVAVSSFKGAEEAVLGGANTIYFDYPISPVDFKRARFLCQEHRCRLYLFTPRICMDSEMADVLKVFEMAVECDGIIASNAGVLNLAHQRGIPVIADSPLNVFNSYSSSFLKGKGSVMSTVSPELTLEEINEIAMSFESEAIVEGRLELMVSEYCLLAELLGCSGPSESICKKARYEFVDEKGFSFPVITDEHCRTHILNSKKLSMLGKLQDIIDAGVRSIRIDARWDEDDIMGVTSAYRKALDAGKMVERKGKIYTRGHYYRGVL
ncbi:putative protease [Methanohalophilus levihalophilus]|uniref:DUF3656 domain-containing U32 family peptidase n=1 Tax=Methanohalophilus levihalophilus TaxID=1431282 RepID=UPI001FDA6C6A|nr:U32 family peptidase [Methanohalophilus levihalophilus]MBP2030598.1 putative protease [Methanohalophilus levihalophilus]